MTDPSQVREAFKKKYGTEPRFFRAPGRVNLIGEHTDYNDGFVLPMAIDLDTIIAGAVRDDRCVRVHSTNLDQTYEFELDVEWAPRPGHWTAYIEGVARVLELKGTALRGCDLLLTSDVPDGSGLSSSAALEISSGLAFLALSGNTMEPVRLALAGQQAEHEYVGTMCGIMDQYISALGKKDHAMLIDCRSLLAQQVPIPGTGADDRSSIAFVICDTKVKHVLASSEYNKRRIECEHAVEFFQERLQSVRALRDVSSDDLYEREKEMPDLLHKRARHVITENERTQDAVAALRAGEWTRVGELMYSSHASLRDDYEVSCKELNIMVDIARNTPGVFGARMTGGGFGGCTINLVESDAVESFKEAIGKQYLSATGIEPTIYVSSAMDGAREIPT